MGGGGCGYMLQYAGGMSRAPCTVSHHSWVWPSVQPVEWICMTVSLFVRSESSGHGCQSIHKPCKPVISWWVFPALQEAVEELQKCYIRQGCNKVTPAHGRQVARRRLAPPQLSTFAPQEDLRRPTPPQAAGSMRVQSGRHSEGHAPAAWPPPLAPMYHHENTHTCSCSAAVQQLPWNVCDSCIAQQHLTLGLLGCTHVLAIMGDVASCMTDLPYCVNTWHAGTLQVWCMLPSICLNTT